MHSLKNNNKTTCLLSHLLSRVTATSRGFHIKCSVCPPCCWTTHSSQRRHWPMARLTKRCDSLLHSVLQNCNELSTLINYSWKSPPPPKQHNRQDFNSRCLEATCQAWGTLITQWVTVVTGFSAMSDISQGSVHGVPKKTDTQFYFWDNRDIGLIGFQFTFWILKKVFSRLREMD